MQTFFQTHVDLLQIMPEAIKLMSWSMLVTVNQACTLKVHAPWELIFLTFPWAAGLFTILNQRLMWERMQSSLYLSPGFYE